MTAYNPADKLTGIMLLPGGEGSGYSATNPPMVMITPVDGNGSGATAQVNIVGGKIVSVSLESPGSGYTAAPLVTFVGGPGSGANYVATIGGGYATVVFTKSPPLNQGLSYVFSRPTTDYAATAIQNLWYSWAQYYVSQFTSFQPPAGVTGSIIAGTNTLTLNNPPPTGNSTLAVGMQVSGQGIVPALGTNVTILGINTFGIKDITVNKPGSGYDPKNPPVVNITPVNGAGSGATATAVVAANGTITGIVVTNAGSGYTTAPTITFSGASKTTATATAVVAPAVIYLSQLSMGGGAGAYTFAAPAEAPFADKTGLKSILVTDQGGGYATPATITFAGGGGNGAAGTVITAYGKVTSVTITGGGAQYTTAPTVTFSIAPTNNGVPGVTATGHAIISGGVVTGVIIDNGGSGYLSVDISGGGGSGATATAVVSLDGHITGVAITNAGKGYTTAPSVSFIGGGGNGQAAATATVGTYVQTYALTFPADQQQTALKFAGSVYEAMIAEAAIGYYTTKSPLLPPSMSLVYTVIGCDTADLPQAIGANSLVGGQVRDLIKSVLRGVYDFTQVPESQWYPNPATYEGGQQFNVYNLDPYVWFVHEVLGLSGYGFSVDDDTSDVSAAASNYFDSTTPANKIILPNTLQIVFSGPLDNLPNLANKQEWFPSVNYGAITDEGTVSNPTTGANAGETIVTLTTVKKYWQIAPPGPALIGAFVSGPGIPPGTVVKAQGDVNALILILSNQATSSSGLVSLTFSGTAPPNPIADSGFETPVQSAPKPNNFTYNPSGSAWTFDAKSGIAGNGSSLTVANGPAPQGTQVGVLKGPGAVTQTVNNLQAGTYTLTFDAAQRLNGLIPDHQTIALLVDKKPVTGGQFTPSGANYTAYSASFTVAAGKPTIITLEGTVTGDIAFIDAVALTVKLPKNGAPASLPSDTVVALDGSVQSPTGSTPSVSTATSGPAYFAVGSDQSLWLYGAGAPTLLSPAGTTLSISAAPNGGLLVLRTDNSQWEYQQGVWTMLSPAGTTQSLSASSDESL